MASYRHRDRLQAVAAAIRGEGGTAHAILGELADGADVRRIAAEAAAALGEVDILVANAGGRARGAATRFDGTTPEHYAATFQINVNSMVSLIQALAPGMKERGWGRIVLMASVAGSSPRDDLPDYGASKAAVINLAASTAKWLGGSGVTVNAVSPGAVMTGAMRRFIDAAARRNGWDGDRDTIERRAVRELFRIPVGRIGRVEEVAALVALLASPLGGFFQGANLRIDGGVLGTVSM